MPGATHRPQANNARGYMGLPHLGHHTTGAPLKASETLLPPTLNKHSVRQPTLDPTTSWQHAVSLVRVAAVRCGRVSVGAGAHSPLECLGHLLRGWGGGGETTVAGGEGRGGSAGKQGTEGELDGEGADPLWRNTALHQHESDEPQSHTQRGKIRAQNRTSTDLDSPFCSVNPRNFIYKGRKSSPEQV
ncbi:hypothetical protein E2C01_028716 [Portunus trituberculatus]|uniref:Uncharacterized protein n=1 Tax=Portunus trituberculatus TaxID=210409 RepID=A0A5B7EPZ0_PORTR|nr:hypothetical protein [Portunus trituberculatus]